MRKHDATRRLAYLGLMAALVFASNYARITLPIGVGGQTSFTLANIVCCLCGLLLGPAGGLASGLGSALYDLTNPLYAAECWITFLTKGTMGLVTGLAALPLFARLGSRYSRCLAGTVLGCAAYYLLYFAKCFLYDGLLIEGLAPVMAAATLPLRFPASIFNAALAILAAPPLAIALDRALERGGMHLA